LETARAVNADVVGLSGLITPSLDEMVHVAQEMERENFRVPLLIGGATTSRAHTAVKIAPHYQSSTVHVLDASRAVGVVNKLVNPNSSKSFDQETRADYERLRLEHSAKVGQRDLLSIADARRNALGFDWENYTPPKPEFLGVRVFCTDPGSAGCQPAVAGSLPATFVSTRFGLARVRLGKLPRRTGQRPVLPRNYGSIRGNKGTGLPTTCPSGNLPHSASASENRSSFPLNSIFQLS
jgi:hypothetical protein